MSNLQMAWHLFRLASVFGRLLTQYVQFVKNVPDSMIFYNPMILRNLVGLGSRTKQAGCFKTVRRRGLSRSKPGLNRDDLVRQLHGRDDVEHSGTRLKGDERILGDSDFVLHVLNTSNEGLERRYRLKSQGFTLSEVSQRVSQILGVAPECI